MTGVAVSGVLGVLAWLWPWRCWCWWCVECWRCAGAGGGAGRAGGGGFKKECFFKKTLPVDLFDPGTGKRRGRAYQLRLPYLRRQIFRHFPVKPIQIPHPETPDPDPENRP